MKNNSKWSKVPMNSVIDEYLTDLKLRGLSPRTIASYRATLRGMLRAIAGNTEMTLAQLTPELVRNYLSARADQDTCYVNHRLHKPEPHKLSAYSLHHTCRNLRAFGSWLERKEYLNPFSEVELPRLPKLMIEPLTPDEINVLMNVWNPETAYGCRWQAMLSFFLDSGVRVSELCGLQMENLEMANYRAKVLGKGAKERWVFFGNRTHRLLGRYLHTFRGETACPYVFLSVDGERLTRNGIEHIIKAVRDRSGIARFHCHLLRHTMASNYAAVHSGDVFGLQAMLGHETLDMTRRYVHLAQTSGAMSQRRTSLLDALEAKDELRFTRRRGQKTGEASQTQDGIR